MPDAGYYSPLEVSLALGVSVTTIKRWVDAGVLPAHKTAGGHRKILLADVLRVVREGNFPFIDLSGLNLTAAPKELDAAKLSDRLHDALRVGDVSLTRSVIHGAYWAGLSMDKLGDAIVAPAMCRLGHEWEKGRIDVMHEHRGTMLCASVLHELKPELEANAEQNRPIAIGGNPEGDHSLLASLLIQLVLLDAGWEAVNLGPHTPLASFRVALRELKPRMIWLSVNYLPDPQAFLDEYHGVYKNAEDAGVPVAIGGQAIHSALRTNMPHTFYGDTLTSLAAFARTLHRRPPQPKRGRPSKPMP